MGAPTPAPMTKIAVRVCYPGVDTDGSKITNMAGGKGRVRALAADCTWVEVPGITYPYKEFVFEVDADGEYEFQWAAGRNAAKEADGAAVSSVVYGPWSDSTVFSSTGAPPVKPEKGKIVMCPIAG